MTQSPDHQPPFEAAHPPLPGGVTRPDDPFRFSCSITTLEQHPLLATPSLARLACQTLQDVAAGQADGQLWGYVVLPTAVHFVVEVAVERHYHQWVAQYKTASEAALCAAIRRRYDAGHWLDAITYFNPVWGEPVYRCWQTGYHTQPLPTPYALSNRVAALLHKPVEQDLVARMEQWPFSSYQAN